MYMRLLGDMLARATILVGFCALMLQCFSAFVVLWCNRHVCALIAARQCVYVLVYECL